MRVNETSKRLVDVEAATASSLKNGLSLTSRRKRQRKAFRSFSSPSIYKSQVMFKHNYLLLNQVCVICKFYFFFVDLSRVAYANAQYLWCSFEFRLDYANYGWLGSRVVSVLDSGAEGSGFKSQSRRFRVTVLGKLFTPIMSLFTK